MCSSKAVKTIISDFSENLKGTGDDFSENLKGTGDDLLGIGGGGKITTHIDPVTSDEDEDEDEFPAYLGRLAAAKRTKRGGPGIGENILTSGAGLRDKAKTKRKSLLG